MAREVTMTSSHIVLTEPVPELLSRIGWKEGLAVTDARYLVHYFRTTADSRILFGWGGGRIARGVEPERRESVDWKVVRQTITDLKRMFPILENVRIERAWGGPIDASPLHMPALRRFADGWVAAFGYTGNGVGPSKLLGEAMADISLGEFGPENPLSPLVVDNPVLLPPEPFSALGGSIIRRGLDRSERRGESGRRVPYWARRAARIPDRLGYRIGR
jgi:glycine/D-amino acid oxidase-like deaminating enzyme